MRIEPFEAAVGQERLDDLRARLPGTRWIEWADTEPWSEGADRVYLEELVAHWTNGFDWRREETRLNRHPQFRAEISGLGIHFIHARGRGPNPLPLIITHGWPGSVLEMLELIPRLTDPASYGGDTLDSFDVVVPSLPGYGFSDPPRRPGMDPAGVARLWLELMTDGLGYRRFGAQGGDWGATVATRMAMLRPEAMAGIHLNYLPGSYTPWLDDGPVLSAEEKAFLAGRDRWLEEEGAYAHLQRTKPLTAAYALHDSPVGLAAWMVEKFRDWSDCGGDLSRRFSRDEVLAMITLYWVTGTIGSSMRLYREASRNPLRLARGERVPVPMGMAVFPAETPASPPREWAERGYDVRTWEKMPSGGHFAAWEEPDLLARSVRAFFRGLRA
ncbi:MAG: epoxide hydrolase [Planctomycetota bacterium]|nr:MAG: epoxide hydrolase [Planctomycetota bacterium]